MVYKTCLLAGLMMSGSLVMSGSAVLADAQRPLGDGPTAPAAPQDSQRVSSPYWDRSDGSTSSAASDLPAADIRTVPIARAQATQAKWTFNQSLDDLSFAVRLSQMQFNLRPDVVAAANEQKAAYETLQNERTRTLASLNDNAAYSASNTLSTNVTEQIADERDSAAPNPTRLLGMASLRMNYVQDNRKLEASLLQRDEAYQKARDRYLAAAQKMSDLRQAESLAVMTDTTLVALRKQVADARIAKLTTASFRDSAIEARDIALDYAGYYRFNDRFHSNYLYGSGYGGLYGLSSISYR